MPPANPKIDDVTFANYDRNPRRHSKAQIRQIARSIEQFGWTLPILIDGVGPESEDEGADRLPEGPDEMTAVSRHGDLWELGDHRLLCGDTRSLADCQALLAGDEEQMVFTDPPYNVAIDGHVCGSGAIKLREFTMASGEMSAGEF